ncbi:DUF417 family protein [Pedobacter sp. Leaf194]|uniref:DUF417 family protein n=1 Tax=Pedobacter sp. Leaf194 TaxID=1736297 RepID=UPI00070368DD|nr:DUF417 family protein [Pedobacter sp. Leaf194]KQS36208.1 hypothetical protein ASG14_12315 [Pedobacter sp. Leaf194]
MISSIIENIAGLDVLGKKVTRLGIVIVLIWIGGLKFFTYEADGIVPFVANSPLMSFFYNSPNDYKKNTNKEGELIPKIHKWHQSNNTYGFADGLGALLIIIGIMVAVHHWFPMLSMVGSLLVVILAIGTLSFLLTTPESWVPKLGDSEYGFPYLSGRGRLVLKDVIMLGGAIVTMSDSAKLFLQRKRLKEISK